MDKITSEQIEKLFHDYEENMIWILLGFSFLSLVIQYFQNLRLATKVEKYKNELSKNAFKFTRHTELQIECLKEMYDLLVTLHFSYIKLIDPEYFTHSSFKSNHNSFKKIFNDSMNFFHRNKILLTEDIITQIGVVHKKYKNASILLNNEIKGLLELEMHHGTDDVQILYSNYETETNSIGDIIKRLKSHTAINTFENDIKQLRELLEKYFKKLVV